MKPAKKPAKKPAPLTDFYRFEVQSASFYHVAWCATWEEAEKVVHAEIAKDVENRLPQNIKYYIFERAATYTVPTIERVSVKRLYADTLEGKIYELPRS